MNAAIYAEMRECGRLNKPGTWDLLRQKYKVPIAAANAAWNAGVAQRTNPETLHGSDASVTWVPDND